MQVLNNEIIFFNVKTNPIWRHCIYQFVNREKNNVCVLSCVLSAVGFQKHNGCIERNALKDFFDNSRYGKDTMDEAEVQNYLKALDGCVWGANARPAGLKILEEEVEKNDIKFTIPTSIDALQDMVMDGISSIFSSIFSKLLKVPVIAVKCRRAAYLFNCLDIQVKIDANKSEPEQEQGGEGARESEDDLYFKNPHKYY